MVLLKVGEGVVVVVVDDVAAVAVNCILDHRDLVVTVWY